MESGTTSNAQLELEPLKDSAGVSSEEVLDQPPYEYIHMHIMYFRIGGLV
jgi:hypothetical protein